MELICLHELFLKEKNIKEKKKGRQLSSTILWRV